MRSVETALAVDFFRRGAIAMTIAFLAMVGLPLWLLIALGASGGVPTGSLADVGLHVNMALLMGFGALVAVVHALGKLPRFFIRPISTARLVTCQMALGMATIAAMYLGAGSLVNLMGVNWPVLGPMLFLATVFAWAMAAIWSFEGSELGKVIACTVTSIPLVIWFNRCYGASTFGDWQAMWDQPSALDLLTMAGASLAAYYLAIVNVARTRRGDLWTFAAWQAWWDRRWANIDSVLTFTSERAAFRWLLWRERMGLLPACLLGSWMLLMILLRVTQLTSTESMLESSATIMLAIPLVIVPVVLGLLQGSSSQDRSWTSMRPALASRPVTDHFLAWEILRSCAISISLTWLTWILGMALAAGLAILLGDREVVVRLLRPLKPDSISDLLPLVIVPLLSWIVTAHMTTLAATGRSWFWATAIFLIVGAPLVPWLSRPLFSTATFELLVNTAIWTSLLLCFGGSIWAFAIAVRKQILAVSVCPILIAVGLLFSLVLWMLGRSGNFLLVSQLWQSVGVCLLAIMPLATMPLAIHWNRHR